MKKEFVPYELALKLKELGFDEASLGFYDAYNGGSHLFLNDRYEPIWLIRTWRRLFNKKYQDTTFPSQSYVEYINGVCLAPLWQQAFDFLLDKVKYKHAFEISISSDDCRLIEDFYTDECRVIIDGSKQECLEKLINLVEL